MANPVCALYQRENKCCERVNHTTDYTTTQSWHEYTKKGSLMPQGIKYLVTVS